MQGIAIQKFRCKLTRALYPLGAIYEGTTERVNYLIHAGYVTAAPQNVPSVETAPKLADTTPYTQMTKKELKQKLDGQRITYNTRHTKSELIKMLKGGA